MSLALQQKNMVQWMVYRDGELSAGPITSYEIRIALRQGTIKLTDYAGQKNSLLRFPIKDIDEVFYDIAPSKKNIRQNHLNETRTNHQKFSQDAQVSPLRLAKSPENRNLNNIPLKNIELNKISEKIYFLKDRKGRKLGPMDEDEILLFAAKIKKLKNVRVLRLNSNQNLPLEKFISLKQQEKSSNQKKKNHAFHPLTLLNEGLPSSRVIEELANFEALRSLSKSKDSNFSLLAGIILLIILILVLLWQLKILNFSIQLPSIPKNTNESMIDSRDPIPPTENTQITNPPNLNAAPVKKTAAPEIQRTDKAEIKNSRKAPKSKPNPNSQTSNRTPSLPNSFILNQSQRSLAVSQPNPPSPLTQNISSIQNPNQTPRKSRLKIGEMQNFSGEVVETSTLFFNPVSIQKCTNKCMIDVKDENGDRAKLIFFKAAYGNQMLQKNGQSKVRARVSDGLTGLDLYLESISSP